MPQERKQIEREFRRGHAQGKAFADQPGHLVLIIERIGRGDNTTGTMSQYEGFKARVTGARNINQTAYVANVFRKAADVKALTSRFAGSYLRVA